MKYLSYILIISLAVFSMAGCGCSGNEKGDGYRIVYVSKDGSKNVEKIEALNDTDAVKQFSKKVSSLVFKNLDKDEPPYEDVYVLSPDGEKLNKNKDLMKAAVGDINQMKKELDDMSGNMEAAFDLSMKYEKAVDEGNTELADSLKKELEKLNVKLD